MTLRPSNSDRLFVTALALSIACLVALSSAGLVLGAEYDLAVPDAIETPEKTVTIEGSTYTISAIATAPPDDEIQVDVTFPDGERFYVDLVNDEEKVEVGSITGIGSKSISVDTATVDPGTYALTLRNETSLQDAVPVVVEGYDVTLDPDDTLPDDIETGDDVTFDVAVTGTALEEKPAGVEVAVWNGESVTREPAEAVDGGYEATFDGLESGEYRAYAAAQGDDEVLGEPEVLGVSEGAAITVGQDGDGGGGDGGDGGGGGDGGDGPDENGTDPGDETDADGSGTDGPTDETDTIEENVSDENDAVMTPTPENESDAPTNDDTDGQPFVGPLSTALLAGVVAVLVAFRVRRDR